MSKQAGSMPVDGMVAAAENEEPSTRSRWQLCYQATSSSVRAKGGSEDVTHLEVEITTPPTEN
jgi:hypothetical protein